MATSFSGGRSQSTQREPPTMGKQLVNFITCGCESSAPFFSSPDPKCHVSYCHHFSSVVSSVVRPSTFHILIFSSETTGPIATKLWWNGPWKFFFQPIYTDYANYAYFDKRSHLNLLLWNRWTKLNQTWQGWSLGGSLSKLCPTAPPSIQVGCCC